MKKLIILSTLIVLSSSTQGSVTEHMIDERIEKRLHSLMLKEFVQPNYEAHLIKRDSLGETYPIKPTKKRYSTKTVLKKNNYLGVNNKRKALTETYIR